MRKVAVLLSLCLLVGCATSNLGTLKSLVTIGKTLGYVQDDEYELLTEGLKLAGILSTNQSPLVQAEIIADILSRKDWAEYATRLGGRYDLKLPGVAPAIPDDPGAGDVLRLYFQADLAARKDAEDVSQITAWIVKSQFFHGPVTLLDLDAEAGWLKRSYTKAPRNETDLTQHGRGNLDIISQAAQWGVIVNCDWCADHGNGAQTPSLRRDVQGSSMYTTAYLETTKAFLRRFLDAYDPNLVILCLEASSPHSVPFYLKLGTWCRETWPKRTFAVNFIDAAATQARHTPGFGEGGILLANSHDKDVQIYNMDGEMHELMPFRVESKKHFDSGKPFIGWHKNQGKDADQRAW